MLCFNYVFNIIARIEIISFSSSYVPFSLPYSFCFLNKVYVKEITLWEIKDSRHRKRAAQVLNCS